MGFGLSFGVDGFSDTLGLRISSVFVRTKLSIPSYRDEPDGDRSRTVLHASGACGKRCASRLGLGCTEAQRGDRVSGVNLGRPGANPGQIRGRSEADLAWV